MIHEIDTRQNPTLTVFDGSREDESKLAKQFWNSVVLMPPVESTLVCKEIKQRTRSRPLQDGTATVKLSTNTSKSMREKSLRDREYEEIAALKTAEDEARQIRAVRERHERLRGLFSKQTANNRTKHEQWAVPTLNKCPINDHPGGIDMIYDDQDFQDRQLVHSLPD